MSNARLKKFRLLLREGIFLSNKMLLTEPPDAEPHVRWWRVGGESRLLLDLYV